MPVLLLIALLLTGCIAGGTAAHKQSTYMEEGGFTSAYFHTNSFVLYGLLRQARADDTTRLHVYIEGDGFAWRSRTQPSTNPTPRSATALRLASADPTTNAVLYLARPCQYVRDDNARMCAVKYWTDARFAPVVIDSVNNAIDQAKARTGAKEVVLVGYSGGGAVAVLAAAQRRDVAFVGSAAGTLDHEVWTGTHGVSPLRFSDNPVAVAPRLRNVPQRHLCSSADSIMPPCVSESYCRALGDHTPCVQVPGVHHGGSWEKVWNYTY